MVRCPSERVELRVVFVIAAERYDAPQISLPQYATSLCFIVNKNNDEMLSS